MVQDMVYDGKAAIHSVLAAKQRGNANFSLTFCANHSF